MDDKTPCDDCAQRALLDARVSLATSLAVLGLALTGLIFLALVRAQVITPADLFPVSRG